MSQSCCGLQSWKGLSTVRLHQRGHDWALGRDGVPAEASSTDIRPAEACHIASHIHKQHFIPMKRSPISHVCLAIPEVSLPLLMKLLAILVEREEHIEDAHAVHADECFASPRLHSLHTHARMAGESCCWRWAHRCWV